LLDPLKEEATQIQLLTCQELYKRKRAMLCLVAQQNFDQVVRDPLTEIQ
jgi:hypothetical protein